MAPDAITESGTRNGEQLLEDEPLYQEYTKLVLNSVKRKESVSSTVDKSMYSPSSYYVYSGLSPLTIISII